MPPFWGGATSDTTTPSPVGRAAEISEVSSLIKAHRVTKRDNAIVTSFRLVSFLSFFPYLLTHLEFVDNVIKEFKIEEMSAER